MLQNLRLMFYKGIYKYWCPFCSRRFRRSKDFEKHYLRERKKAVPLVVRNPAMNKVMAEKLRVNSKKRKRHAP